MNQRGFGVVSFLALTPLLITIVVVMLAVMRLLTLDAKAKHECRSQLLKSQNEISRRLEELLKLNSKAKMLRMEREAADAGVKAAAAYPLLLPAALEIQATVIAMQLALAARQKTLIYSSRLQSQTAPAHTLVSIRSSLTDKLLSSSPQFSNTRLRTGLFPLTSSPQHSLTPDYEPAMGFSREQVLSLSLEVPISNLFPKWIGGFVDFAGLTLKTSCTTTIEKGERRWAAALKPDNWL
ncbi:MAG TPA: hypothetical protein VM432_13225 [Bdellovibrionales bacterium]|nr:hypothetical protein [Bdellovibrionales bacterium]